MHITVLNRERNKLGGQQIFNDSKIERKGFLKKEIGERFINMNKTEMKELFFNDNNNQKSSELVKSVCLFGFMVYQPLKVI